MYLLIGIMLIRNSEAIILPYEENINICTINIIKNNYKDVTLVNFNSDDKLKEINLNCSVVTRKFLFSSNDLTNKVYVIHMDEYSNDKFNDLTKDTYWNPSGDFIIEIDVIDDVIEIFRYLHGMYAFKVAIVVDDEVYRYKFDEINHCKFTTEAVVKEKCDEFKIDVLETNKVPYSECDMTVMVDIREPFIFRPINSKVHGYEEAFVNLLVENMKFENLSLVFNDKLKTGLLTGTVYANFSCDGILEMIDKQIIDGVVGGQILTPTRMKAFDISYPHLHDDAVIVVRKPTAKKIWEIFILQFDTNVWILLFATLIIYSTILLLSKSFGEINFSTFQLTLLIGFRYLLLNVYNHKKYRVRHLMILWAVYTWMMACFYLSSLSSIFTKPIYNKKIDTVQELKDQNYDFYMSANAYKNLYLHNELHFDVMEYATPKVCARNEICFTKVAFGERIFYISSKLSYQYFKSGFYTKSGEPLLRHLNEKVRHVFSIGYFKRGNPNLKKIRLLEERIIEHGIHQMAINRCINNNKIANSNFSDGNEVDELTLEDIFGIYLMYLGGVLISIIVFILEIIL